MDKTKVTLVLGTYKEPDLITQTLDGFVNQTFKDFKVIVVDDNSPEDSEIIERSRSIVESYSESRFHYIKNDVNIGVPHVFRKWINLVDTEYIYITGAGDRLLPNALELMIYYLDNNPESSMVHGREIMGDKKESTSLFPESTTARSRLYLEYHLIGGAIPYSWSQSSAMFRTEIWKVRNIPVVHDHYWDYYFHCKYLLYSETIGYINECLAVRQEALIPYEEYVNNNYFLAKVERLYQGMKFIDEHEFFMILKGYPTNKYRSIIAKRLIWRSFFVKKHDESIYCLYLGLRSLIKVFLSNATYYLFVSPIRLFSRSSK